MKLSGAGTGIKVFHFLRTTSVFGIYVKICALSGVRPRYFFTRDNKLRLRYLAYIWIFVIAFSIFDYDGVSNATTSHNIFSENITIASLNPSHDDNVEFGQNYGLNNIAHTYLNKDLASNKDLAHVKQDDESKDNTVSSNIFTQKAYYVDPNGIKKALPVYAMQQHAMQQDVRAVNKRNPYTKKTSSQPSKDQPSKEIVQNTLQPHVLASLDWEKSFKGITFDKYLKATITSLENDLKEANALTQKQQAQAQKQNASKAKAAPENVKLASLAPANLDMINNEFENKYKIGLYPIPPRPQFEHSHSSTSKKFHVKQGDTFAAIMQKAGVKSDHTQKIIRSMRNKFDPRYMRVGQKIHVKFRHNRQGNIELANIMMPLEGQQTLAVHNLGQGSFTSDIEKMDLRPKLKAHNIDIQTSLYGSAMKQGLPRDVVDKVLRIYAWDIDFQRDLRKGDRLEVLYEALYDSDGDLVSYGDLKYANLSVKGKFIPVYQFKMQNGRFDYFEPNGHSVRKALMRTPIDGARISSGYGMRRHPILGYSKMHKGVDFAAPMGTPIFAAGDGVVERVGRYGAYGKYIRVRHNRHLKTAYAHLSRYKSGLKNGDSVKQGDVIGYLGNTGRSTGPHLHYEVIMNGKQVNPSDLDLPTGTILKGRELKRFKDQMNAHLKNYALYLDGSKIASVDASNL